MSQAGRHGLRPGVSALIGLLSAAAALGVAELGAAAFGPGSSPPIAVGGALIDATPEWLKGFAIRSFGESDKPVLLLGLGATIATVAALLGIASARRPGLGVTALIAFGSLGVAAALTRPANGVVDAIPTVLGTVAGVGVYRYLRRTSGLAGDEPERAERDGGAGVEGGGDDHPRIRGFDRRRFFKATLVTAGMAGGAATLGPGPLKRSAAAV